MVMDRKLPLLTAENRGFWQGGAQNQLLIYRCADCSRWFHPPAPLCPSCGCLQVGPEPVSGRGSVHSFTINMQPWDAAVMEPYVVAIIELDEQPGLRFLSNVVGCPPADVTINMPVRVAFTQFEDVWLPQFEKVA